MRDWIQIGVLIEFKEGEGGQIVKKANIHPPKLGIHKGTVYSFYKDTLTALENRGENHWVNHNGIEVEIKMKGHFVIVTSLKKKAEAVHPVQTQNGLFCCYSLLRHEGFEIELPPGVYRISTSPPTGR
ncbi:hypothetical protein RRG08_023205 [Elysia crispata]|uniref:Uncharacterized protein n=1 Tax=Elysia crispata TaxID=231223 RepID=A0AAE0ZPR8_9GAST|nr:hypothetical protein RRG08_023205 [Elysia crispata]